MSEKLLDYLSEGIVIFNDDYKIQFCNYSLLKQLQYSKDELYNENSSFFFELLFKPNKVGYINLN